MAGCLEHSGLVCVQDVVQRQFASGPAVSSDGRETLTRWRWQLDITGHCVYLGSSEHYQWSVDISYCHLSRHQGGALGEGGHWARGQHLIEVPLPGNEGVRGPGHGGGGGVAGAGRDGVSEAPEESE